MSTADCESRTEVAVFPGAQPSLARYRYEAGTVVAEASIDGELVGLQGNIEKDNTFQLGGITAGDGAFPGNYRIAVMSASHFVAESV